MTIAGDASDNVYSVAPLMDPNNPEYAEQPAMKLYKEKVARYEPEADVTNGIVAYGWTVGALLEQARGTQQECPADRDQRITRAQDQPVDDLLEDVHAVSVPR